MEYITDITQTVINKIEVITGEKFSDSDLFLLEESIEKVRYYIKNKTNQSEVPKGLKYVFIDRVLGEYLTFKLKVGQLTVNSLNFSRIAKEISEGDTKVVFENTATTGDKFEVFLSYLSTYGEEEFYKYRRLVW